MGCGYSNVETATAAPKEKATTGSNVEIVTDAPKEKATTADDMHEAASLTELIANGAIQLIKLTWLKAHLEEGPSLCRRQELPDEALMHPETAVQLVDKEYGCLVISHAWLSPTHPDADDVRAKDLRRAILHAESDNTETLFFDYLSLYQSPRTDEQTMLFRQALGSMHKVYSSSKWAVYSLISVSGTSPNPRPYFDRGWCVFESMVAQAGAIEWKVIKNGQSRYFDMATPVLRRPEDFEDLIDTLHFTSKKADPDTVKKLYARIWPEVSTNEKIYFRVDQDEQVGQIERVLPALSNCKTIFVRRRGLSEAREQSIEADCEKRGIKVYWNDLN